MKYETPQKTDIVYGDPQSVRLRVPWHHLNCLSGVGPKKLNVLFLFIVSEPCTFHCSKVSHHHLRELAVCFPRSSYPRDWCSPQLREDPSWNYVTEYKDEDVGYGRAPSYENTGCENPRDGIESDSSHQAALKFSF